MRSGVLFLALGLSACGFHPTGSGELDAAGDNDGTVVDAAATDGSLAIDSALLDAALIDATVIDAALIDARSIDARVPCPVSYDLAVGGSLYRFDDVAASYIAATASCTGDLLGRTHLATFEGSDLNAVIDATSAGDGDLIYVGARCTTTGAACNIKNNWRWIGSASAVANGLWNTSEPSQSLSNSYTSHESGTWLLTSITGTGDRPYLCECEP